MTWIKGVLICTSAVVLLSGCAPERPITDPVERLYIESGRLGRYDRIESVGNFMISQWLNVPERAYNLKGALLSEAYPEAANVKESGRLFANDWLDDEGTTLVRIYIDDE